MAKKATVKIKLNSPGVRELLQSDAVASICEGAATDVLARLPDADGYRVSTYRGKTRVNVSIAAVTPETRKDNLQNNTLLKALGQK